MEAFPLDAVFTAPGALVGAALVAGLVELVKQLTPYPATGRAPMMLAAGIAAGLVGLAALDTDSLRSLEPGAFVLGLILAWLNVTTAAIGTHATTRKAIAVATRTTNPDGPDPENPGG